MCHFYSKYFTKSPYHTKNQKKKCLFHETILIIIKDNARP